MNVYKSLLDVKSHGLEHSRHKAKMAELLFILAPPRSFSSVICAMVGQHPQMYGLPELNLFTTETVSQWWRLCHRPTFPQSHGLLRAVAQIFFGEQSDDTIRLAAGWIKERSSLTTGAIVEAVGQALHPLIAVEKSPGLACRLDVLERVYHSFPQARFIHLVRHPRSYGEAVMSMLTPLEKLSSLPSWLVHLASFPSFPSQQDLRQRGIPDLDPQRSWYHCHSTILQFLRLIPASHKMIVRGEDLLNQPKDSLRQIAAWLGLCTDPQAINEMIHPERSPFARYGPALAPLGYDEFFLQDPVLRPRRPQFCGLEGPLSWRNDGRGFLPIVKELAMSFGYT